MRLSFVFMLVTLALLSACGTIYETEPVTYGTGAEELKLSPCACIKIDLDNSIPDFLFEPKTET